MELLLTQGASLVKCPQLDLLHNLLNLIIIEFDTELLGPDKNIIRIMLLLDAYYDINSPQFYILDERFRYEFFGLIMSW